MKCSRCGCDLLPFVSSNTPHGNFCPTCEEIRGRYARIHPSPDSNVEKVREMLLQRSLKGLEKYGVTTDRTDMSRLEWLRHALEEGLDQCVYLMKLISDEENEIERGKA